jgi:CheY-like chemotaxis protein
MSDFVVPTVLIVEDEPLVRLVAADLLAEAQCRVVEAANAAEALAVLEAGVRIDVLLADVDMPPGINGCELAREVDRRWPRIGIVVTSGRQHPAAGDLPDGAVFLPKPSPNAQLVAWVKTVAARKGAAYAEGEGPTAVPRTA